MDFGTLPVNPRGFGKTLLMYRPVRGAASIGHQLNQRRVPPRLMGIGSFFSSIR
jgi:hypothetical protein